MASLEHLDTEILWNLKLLSEVIIKNSPVAWYLLLQTCHGDVILLQVIRSDGTALLPHITQIKHVLSLSLHVKDKDASDMAGALSTLSLLLLRSRLAPCMFCCDVT